MFDQLFRATVTVIEAPAPHVAPRPGYAENDVAAVLARLLETPLHYIHLTAQTGRMVRVEYAPMDAPDPDIVLMMGPRGSVVNRAVLGLQTVRDYHTYYRAGDAWYNLADRAVAAIARALVIVAASPAESAFVLDWARAVRDRGRIIHPRLTTL